MESGSEEALLMRYVCSMYSVILCRKLSGSLRTIGIVIFDSSCVKRKKKAKKKQKEVDESGWRLIFNHLVKSFHAFLPGQCIFSGYPKD